MVAADWRDSTLIIASQLKKELIEQPELLHVRRFFAGN